MRRILIAGMGNVLRRDDGFGVELAKLLERRYAATAHVRVIEVGIGGIHLVQELMSGYEALLILDAVDRGSAPGSVHLLKPDVPDLAGWPAISRADFLADMHYTTPSKALILARGLGILPPVVLIVGCQPLDGVNLGIGLSEPVQAAVRAAAGQIDEVIARLSAGAT